MNRHPNPHRRQTSDDLFSKPLLAYLGDDIELPDGTTIRAIVHEVEETDAGGRQRSDAVRGGITSNVYSSVKWAKIPTANLGTLAAEQTVMLEGQPHFVPTLQPTEKGWTVFTLEPTA